MHFLHITRRLKLRQLNHIETCNVSGGTWSEDILYAAGTGMDTGVMIGQGLGGGHMYSYGCSSGALFFGTIGLGIGFLVGFVIASSKAVYTSFSHSE